MRNNTFLKILMIVFVFFITVNANAQFTITSGGTEYTQDFNGLTTAGTWSNNTTLTGWYARTDATTTISTVGLNTGSTTSAGLYSFGSASATDRALGFASSNTYTGASGTGKGYLGWRLKNNTGSEITSITVKWTGEQWRKENNAAAHSINLMYQIGSTVSDLLTGTWISASSTFTSPVVGATTATVLDGNLTANRSVDITATLTVSIPAGNEILLRWEDLNDSGNDHQMAIDDVKIIATTSGGAPSPTISVSEVTVPEMSAQIGSNDIETITVNGQNLTGNVSLSLSGTDAALFSLSTNSITPVSGSITDISVSITYTPVSSGNHSATLTLSSSGATDVVKTLTASAIWPPIDAPVATDATGLNSTGFTANWNAVSGATEYKVNVYTKTTGSVIATDLFISEYGEGSGGNKKYIEIFNGSGSNVDLSAYTLKKSTNGGGWSLTYTFPVSTTLNSSDVIVIANNITDVLNADIYDSNFANWNGDDAIGLFKNDVLIDVFGVPDNDPGTGWAVAGIANATVDKIIIRKPSVNSPNTSWTISSGTSIEDSEWIVSEGLYSTTDQTTNLGSHNMSGSGTTTTPISGSPFTVTGETSKSLTGLSSGTTYYYTVQALNANVQSSESNEIAAITSFGTGLNENELRSIAVVNNKIHIVASTGQTIEVFNAVGQRLLSHQTRDGLNILDPQAKGLMIIKTASQVVKLIL